MKGKQQYESRGYITHRFIKTPSVDLCKFDKVEDQHVVNVSNSDLFTGENFLQDVLKGCLTDYDGWITHVFLDNYETKIRLGWCGNLSGAYKEEYLVLDEDEWKQLCDNHKIEVYWVNK